jgi:hypothetical protein
MDALTGRSVHPHGLLLASDARAEGWSNPLRSAHRRGDLVKVRPGAYVSATRWAGMSLDERYSARLHAVHLVFSRPVFARESAAALHGLPLLHRRLARIHLHQTTPSGSGRRGDVTVHAGTLDPDIVERQGMRLTSPARTVLDLARVLPHGEALALADAAIRPHDAASGFSGSGAALCAKSVLVAAAAASVPLHGGWSAYLVVSEADPLSGSVGESIARSLFLRLGAPPPELQAAIWDEAGLIGYADFFWRDFGVIGEFDGRLKYGADNPSGRAPADVVYREKLREDRMRRVSSGFIRLAWADLEHPPRVAHLLHSAGIPLERARAWREMRPYVSSAR